MSDNQSGINPDTIFDLVNSNITTSKSPKSELRKTREKEKIRLRKANRVTYDILPELRLYIRSISEKEHIPASQFVVFALLRFMEDYETGLIDLTLMKRPSKSPRYDWNISYPQGLIKKLSENIKVVKSS
jgi:hypothetical protein